MSWGKQYFWYVFSPPNLFLLTIIKLNVKMKKKMPIRNYWAFPIRVIRLFTDPFVDFFIDIWLPAFGRAIFFPTLRVLTRMFDLQVLDYEEVLVMSDEIITTIPVNQFILARSNEVPIFSYCSDEMVTYGFFDEWMRFFQPQFCSTLAVRGICVFAGWALISLLLLSYLVSLNQRTYPQKVSYSIYHDSSTF